MRTVSFRGFFNSAPRLLMLSTLALSTLVVRPAHAQYYTLKPLTSGSFALGSPGIAYQISPGNNIVGQISNASYTLNEATLFNLGVFDTAIGGSVGYGINDTAYTTGAFVGTQDVTGTGDFEAFVASLTGVVTALPGVVGETGGSEAFSVNANGNVVGASFDEYGTQFAVLWEPSSPVGSPFFLFPTIPTLGGDNNIAYSINDGDVIAGSSDTAGDLTENAYLYNFDTSTLTNLSPAISAVVPGVDNEALYINNDGLVTGWAGNADITGNASEEYLYNPTGKNLVENLHSLAVFNAPVGSPPASPGYQTIGQGIADTTLGAFSVTRVVGGATLNGSDALGTLYEESTTPIPGFVQGNLIDLNTLLTPGQQSNWQFLRAESINSGDEINGGGNIVGYAVNKTTGATQAVELSPQNWFTLAFAPVSHTGAPIGTVVGSQNIPATVALLLGKPGLVTGSLVQFSSTSPNVVLPAGFPLSSTQNFTIKLLDVSTSTPIVVYAFYNGNIISATLNAEPWLNSLAPRAVTMKQGQQIEISLTLNQNAPVAGLPLSYTVTDIGADPGKGATLTVNNGSPLSISGGRSSQLISLKAGSSPILQTKEYNVSVTYKGDGPTNKTVTTTVTIIP